MLRRVLATNDLLRNALYVSNNVSPSNQHEVAQTDTPEASAATAKTMGLTIPLEILPTKLQWQIHDHCAAFTRLYAAYEQFIEALVFDYLELMPELYETYADLPEDLQTQHRVGTGHILVKLGGGQYKELEEHVVLDHLVRCAPGARNYKLLVQAFLVDRQNFRFDMLIRLLTSLGIENAHPAILRNTALQDFMRARRGDGGNIQKELDDFIQFRNEAAHTSVENIVATEEIRVIADFITALCDCVSEIVGAVVLRRRMALGQYSSLGKVTEIHYGGRIAILNSEQTSIAVQDELIVVRKDECFVTQVESIRVSDQDLSVVHATKGQEIGLGLSRKVKIESALRRLNLPAPAELPREQAPEQDVLSAPSTNEDSVGSDLVAEQVEDVSDSTSNETSN